MAQTRAQKASRGRAGGDGPNPSANVGGTITLRTALRSHLPLLAPTMLGFLVARSGMIVAAYGSYEKTDAGIYTDGSSLIALIPMFVLMCVLGFTDRRISKPVIYRTTVVAMAVEAAGLTAIAAIEVVPGEQNLAYLALTAVTTIASWWCMYYWLRRAKGTSCAAAVIIVFGSLAMSELAVFLTSFLPRALECGTFALVVLTQFPLMLWAQRLPLPADVRLEPQSQGYFSFAEKMADSVRFLGTTAVGTFFMSIAIGFLRGYPDGAPISFSLATHVGMVALTLVVFYFLIRGVATGKVNTMTVMAWIVMQACGAIALLAFTALPNNLDIGGMFANAMNVTMTAFMCYLVIAFSTYGTRDPYYYATAGWMVFILPRSLVRVAMLVVYPSFPSDALLPAVVGALLLLSAQFVFVQFMQLEQEEAGARKAASEGMQRILGLKEDMGRSSAVSRALVREQAAAIQKQFLLSDRETEALALYACGLTQAKIAEELCISPGTTHTHIKRIYAKTDLHSRQAILDYIEQYVSL